MKLGLQAWGLNRNSVQFKSIVHLITIISLIISISYTLYYASTRNQLIREVTESNQRMLKQIASSYELFITNTIDETMMYIEYDRASPYGWTDPLQVSVDRYSKLTNISKISSYIYSVYYFTKERNEIFVSNENQSAWDDFYDRAWLKSLGNDKDLEVLPSRRMPTLIGGEREVIPIVIRYPFNSPVRTETYIVNLDANRLFHEFVQKTYGHEHLSFKIVDKSGLVIVSDRHKDLYRKLSDFPYLYRERIHTSESGDFTTKSANRKLQISFARSDMEMFGWTYISEIDYNTLAAGLARPLWIVLGISAFSLMCSALAAIVISTRAFRPVREILSTYAPTNAEDQVGLNEFEAIKRYFAAYIGENHELKSTLETSLPIMKEQFMHQVLARNAFTAEQLREKAGYFQVREDGTYVALVAELDSPEEFVASYSFRDRLLFEFAIKNIMTELMQEEGEGFIADMETYKYGVALRISDSEAVPMEAARRLAVRITENIQSYLKLSISVGIGEPCEGLQAVHKSYRQAAAALASSPVRLGEVLVHLDLAESGGRVPSYPYEAEEQLLAAVMLGNKEQAKTAAELVFRPIQAHRPLNIAHLQMFSIQLLNAMMKQMNEAGAVEEEIFAPLTSFAEVCAALLACRSEEECRQHFGRYIDALSEFYESKRVNASNVQVKKIIDYIHEHYDQPISVESVAEYTGLNRNYAGRLFKQVMDMGIVDYINHVRIENSKQLLMETNLKVMDIAVKVGYGNTQYFIRVFKQSTGMTPKQYKDEFSNP